MQALNYSFSYRLMWVAGSVLIILSSVASIAAVLAWKMVPSGSNSVVPTSSAVPSSTVVTKAYTTLAPPISYPLGENMEMMALLDLHRQARNRVLIKDYKIVVRFEDGPSRLVQKTARNLAD